MISKGMDHYRNVNYIYNTHTYCETCIGSALSNHYHEQSIYLQATAMCV